MSSSDEFGAVLRRLKPQKRLLALTRREKSNLPFLGRTHAPPRLLYDTTVYIDILQNHFPKAADMALRAADAWHSTVAQAELVAPIGLLHPKHPGTAQVTKQIRAILGRLPLHRTISPDRHTWISAAVLAGTLARLQGHALFDRQRLLNDALIFSTARKHGMAVLTRNISDFDLLQQLEPSASVIFYDRE